MEETTPQSPEPAEPQQSIFSEDDFSIGVYDKHIRQARNGIFATAIVLTISVIILAATAPADYEYLWVDLTFWSLFIAAFIALGFWTKKRPYYAIVCALILYGVFIILNAILDINTIYKGIIFKVIIISLLIKGLKDGKVAQEMQQLRK